MTLPFPFKKEILLSEMSSFGIGGPARFFACASTLEQMQQMLLYCDQVSMPFFVLGKGSNSLFDDRGFDGLVIHNRIDYAKQKENTFIVGGGYSFARLGGQTARLGLSGLEFASGIPATVGGAIYMNAGANGGQTADSLTQVIFIDAKGEVICYKKEELSFDYRFSSFQKLRGAIVEGTFSLNPKITAKEDQKKILDYRLKTQPYKDKSAGCIFRNPDGCLSAGRLIDECGLKGASCGEAAVSTMHANFIVNKQSAKASDVLGLIEKIKERVYLEKGIHLEEEIRYIPYS